MILIHCRVVVSPRSRQWKWNPPLLPALATNQQIHNPTLVWKISLLSQATTRQWYANIRSSLDSSVAGARYKTPAPFFLFVPIQSTSIQGGALPLSPTTLFIVAVVFHQNAHGGACFFKNIQDLLNLRWVTSNPLNLLVLTESTGGLALQPKQHLSWHWGFLKPIFFPWSLGLRRTWLSTIILGRSIFFPLEVAA